MSFTLPAACKGVRAIITDTGGTVFDWHTAVQTAFTEVGGARDLSAEWSALTKTWRKLSTTRVDKGLPLAPSGKVDMDMDDVLRETLNQTLAQHSVTGFTAEDEAELVHSWRNMKPWDDIPSGVARLRKALYVVPFTILKAAQVIQASKGYVDWDTVVSCEMIGIYKTHPTTYATACKWLDLPKEQVLLVTTHNNDLRAAHAFGLRTAFVYREKEWSDMPSLDSEPDPVADWVAKDFEDLARQLGL